MGKPKITGQIVIQYLSDERWFNMPALTLARKIYNENNKVFNSIDHVRDIIRYYRNAMGSSNRQRLSNHDFIDYVPYNPFRLPESDAEEFYPFLFPSHANNVLCLYDVHVPYQDNAALTAALEYGLKNNVNALFFGGDFIDCHKVSKFCPDPRKRDIKGEIEHGKEILEEIRKAFPKAYMFYLEGNHEDRLQSYLMLKAPELFNLDVFKLSELMEFDRLKIEKQTVYKQTVKMGGLNVVHGHELGSSVISPVNIARGLFLRAKTSTICGHHHQVSEHTEQNLNGKITTCWSVGTLGELHPAYLPNNKWSHGFAHIQWDGEDFSVKNYRILNGKIL